MQFIGTFLVTSFIGFATVVAAVPKAGLMKPVPILRGSGVTTGGESGTSLSLMDVRRSSSTKTKLERIVMDFGGSDMKPSKGFVGYYHAELQDNPARLILELPQTYTSRLPEKEIMSRLKDSMYIRKSSIQFDQSVQSMTMIFELSHPIQLKVTPVKNPNFSGKIVIDMMPLLAAPLPAASVSAKKASAKAETKAGSKTNKRVRR